MFKLITLLTLFPLAVYAQEVESEGEITAERKLEILCSADPGDLERDFINAREIFQSFLFNPEGFIDEEVLRLQTQRQNGIESVRRQSAGNGMNAQGVLQQILQLANRIGLRAEEEGTPISAEESAERALEQAAQTIERRTFGMTIEIFAGETVPRLCQDITEYSEEITEQGCFNSSGNDISDLEGALAYCASIESTLAVRRQAQAEGRALQEAGSQEAAPVVAEINRLRALLEAEEARFTAINNRVTGEINALMAPATWPVIEDVVAQSEARQAPPEDDLGD